MRWSKAIICTELGQGGHEQLLTLLAAHASKPMGCAAQELNQLIHPVSERSTSQACGGNREIPRFRPTALDIAQAPTPRLRLRISEIMPATSPRAARGGRADAAEAVGCTAAATAKLAPLSLKIPPPPFPIQQHVPRVENQAAANHTDFISGRFLAERTYLVGY
jgi:hypothetical protein